MYSMTVIDSRDCTWYFDSETMRFRSTYGDAGGVTRESPWLPYRRLIADGRDRFVIVLDRAETRTLRFAGTRRRPVGSGRRR
jgi:hypothetical protein